MLTACGLLALAVPGAGFAASAVVDVVTVPGEEAGEIEARTWRAEAEDAYLKRVTFDVPAAVFRQAALTEVLESEGTIVGGVTAELSNGLDASSVGGGISVAVGSCRMRVRCVPVRIVRGSTGRVWMTIRASTSDSTGGGITWIEFTLRNLQTAAGPLLRVRPDARVLDTRVAIATCSAPTGQAFDRCGPDGPTVTGRVREIVAGASVTIRAGRTRTTYDGTVLLFGRVQRAGRPSAGEEVVLEPYWRATGFDPSPGRDGGVQTASGPDGSFRIEVPLRASSRWIVKAAKPATETRPALATLADVTERPIWVHAPRPEIELVGVRTLRDGRTRAQVAVTNPLADEVDLTARLVVGRRSFTRRFTAGADRLSLTVTGRTGARVQAYVFEPHPSGELGIVSPRIAAGWSERLRLAARVAG